MLIPHADRNLLFGILALQMDFITREALIKAMHGWVLEKSKPLGQILTEHGAMDADLCKCVEEIIEKHLQVHGNDAEKSLAAISSLGSVRAELQQIADPDLDASLSHLSMDRSTIDDPAGVQTRLVGASTSSGARFHILRPHAKGGLGEVFVARDEEVHREVALKEIQDRHADNPGSRARFLLEAEITGGLEHPGIVPVYGLGTYADGRPFYAMRFIRGDSLKDAIERFHKGVGAECDPGERTVAFRNLLGRFMDVCNAIGYAHSRGVLHRDLKPGNIMLGKYGETLVVDWGLAKAVGKSGPSGSSPIGNDEPTLRPASGSDVAETVAGQAIGTPAFMSPEQAAGQLDLLGPASDVYSLGATLFCLLTGRAPFADKDVKELLRKARQGEFARPRQVKSDVPAPLEAICLKAMAREPEQRYGSPRALADDIEHWLADEPVTAWPEPVTVKASRWMRRNKALVSGMTAAILVSLVSMTVGYVWYESVQAESERMRLIAQADADRKQAEADHKQALADAETARKEALAEEKVRQGLDQARQTRDELHKILKQPGGVHELLNQPVRWEAYIKAARAGWQRARDHAEETRDPQWGNVLKRMDDDLKRDQADFDLATRLEKIRLDLPTWVGGKFDPTPAVREYPVAFRNIGLDFKGGRQEEIAEMIQQSAVKDQLLAALDNWAHWHVLFGTDPRNSENLDLSRRIFEVSRIADPDPLRVKLRDPAQRNYQEMEKLAEEFHKDQKLQDRLSPQMISLISGSLPPTKRESWLKMGLAAHPADFWLNLELANDLREEKRGLEAEGYYRVSLVIRPDNAVIHTNLSAALFLQKRLPSAINSAMKALDIDSENAEAWNNLGLARLEQKDLPKAVEALEQAVQFSKGSAQALSNLGSALGEQKRLPEAIEAHMKALKLKPKNATFLSNYGLALFYNNELAKAIEAFDEAVKIDGNVAETLNLLGVALQKQKTDLPRAIDSYRKSVALDSKVAHVWNSLGTALKERGDMQGAVNAFKKAADVDRNDDLAWFNLGVVLGGQKNFPEAMDAFKKSRAANPKSASAWKGIGSIYLKQKDRDLPEAEKAFRQAIELKPDDAEANLLLGLALYEQGDFLAALPHLQVGHRLGAKQSGWPHPSAAIIKGCQTLLDLEKRLPGVLNGDEASVPLLFALADLCRRYKSRYRDAAELYAKAFTADPKKAEDLVKGYRYAAARAAALAGLGKNVDAKKLEAKDQARLRTQALDWLRADLAARANFLTKNPMLALRVQSDMQQWQNDADLAGLRDAKELAKLPPDERAAFKKFWKEVDNLAKQARSSYTQTDHKGQLAGKERELSYPIQMTAGKIYIIDMESRQFDTYLRLEDDNGKVVTQNDDISPTNLNSRIVFSASKDGDFRIVATSFGQRGVGAYTITVREFAAKKN